MKTLRVVSSYGSINSKVLDSSGGSIDAEEENMENNDRLSSPSSAVSNAGAWSMNIISSLGIIMANKQILSSSGYAFTFATTLTGFHFVVTALVGYISNAAGYSQPKHVPSSELLWFSLISNTSIASMNLSLMLNSVGFYQIAKLSMVPVVCFLEWVLHGKTYSPEVKTAVVIVVVGVGVCTVTDVEVNPKGFLCACLAVLSTSMQQIYIGALQKKYSIGSFQLLSKTAPMQALLLVILAPSVDYCLSGRTILNYTFFTGVILFILLSCLFAVFCNISQYLCIGRFSAVSFQVLGHMKTIFVLILGWILFDSNITFKNVVGMMVAVLGMLTYSWAVEKEKSTGSKTKFDLSEEDLKMESKNLDYDDVPNSFDLELGDEFKGKD